MLNKKEVAKNILIGLGVTGVVTAVIMAPGLAKAIPTLSKIDYQRINIELRRLYKRGLVEIRKKKDGITEIKLTREGREKIKGYTLDNVSIDKPKNWDKKWRIIIFDIPISKNSSRSKLRRFIKRLGLYKLQDSVFIHPYPCYEVVSFLRDYLGVSQEVLYLEVDRIENQDKLIEHFFT